jgi:hypothetical protein
MISGDLIRFISHCTALTLDFLPSSQPKQVSLWPSAVMLQPGEIGVILKTDYYDEVGGLCEILIGDCICLDVPYEKIEILPTPAAQ